MTDIEELRKEVISICEKHRITESLNFTGVNFEDEMAEFIQQKVIEARIKQIDNLWEAVPIDTEHVGTVKDISNLQKIKLKSQLNHNKKGDE